MSTTDRKETEPKKTVYKETDELSENQTSGETSSATDFDRSGFSKTPERKNKPLGSSHEPGTTPGTE
ncbi:MAG TPA: hypothetical protein VKB19_14150 [Pedobacter sp.]|nr:hypothetical protein [Pedobacter sp.]